MQRQYILMAWRDALFLHWPIDADRLAERLPAGISPRTHSGSAWLGVIAFVMEDIRPRGFPRALGLTFGELNLRSYVTGPDGGDGIYFFNLDADDPLGVSVARWFYQLPYYKADMRIQRTGSAPTGESGRANRSVEFVSNRTHRGVPSAYFDATYGPTGESFTPEQGSLEQFLVENYRFYVAGGDVSGTSGAGDAGDVGGSQSGEKLFYGDIAHPPWDLYEADIDLRSTNLFEVNGFERPDEAPLAHYSPGVPVDADRIRTLD
ncbi:YqjF family protein [Halolamina sp.]|jgi:hypothetical protein|uniref:YqjF family protein n=1 Tax=Halolamina sp. TaxID=1940283 RepID=UPI000223BC2E|nr:Protein of unknown function DUF2071 [halophilic archaeon DL31]